MTFNASMRNSVDISTALGLKPDNIHAGISNIGHSIPERSLTVLHSMVVRNTEHINSGLS
ncbi:hypothetical protein MspRI1_24470 [Marinobacter sp. RI1]